MALKIHFPFNGNEGQMGAISEVIIMGTPTSLHFAADEERSLQYLAYIEDDLHGYRLNESLLTDSTHPPFTITLWYKSEPLTLLDTTQINYRIPTLFYLANELTTENTTMALGFDINGRAGFVTSGLADEEGQIIEGYRLDSIGKNLCDANWHHLAISYDGEKGSLYVDGRICESTEQALNLTAQFKLLVFNMPAPGTEIVDNNVRVGQQGLYDFRIYDTALSGSEIRDLINVTGGEVENNYVPFVPKTLPKDPEEVAKTLKYLRSYFDWYHIITTANIHNDTKHADEMTYYNVDLENRTVEAPKDLGVSTDQRAEIVYFSMKRYYQGYDLSKATGIIEYINAKGEKYTYGIPFYDIVTLNQDCISPVEAYDAAVYEAIKQEQQRVVFPWVVSSDVTAAAGDIKFNISFYVVDAEGKLITSITTHSATSHVKQGIDINPELHGLINNLELPTIQELYDMYASLAPEERALYWEDEVNEAPKAMPYLIKMTLPPQ